MLSNSFLPFFLFPVIIRADCECGYTASVLSNNSATYLFTDVIESDFFHIPNITLDTDWHPQSYNVTAEVALGTYGFNFTTSNVVSNSILDANNWTGPGILGGDPGVGLTVNGGIPADGFVDTGSMDSNRTDMIWGTYRASLKLTPIVGTCGAFFWYFNDSQEIDLEFLSEQFVPENNTYPVNLVIQNEKTVQSGYVKGPDNFQVVNLPFNPTTAYHEYRIDYVPGNIVFYGDGKVLHAFPGPTTPYEPGHLILTHWSNGNPTWSAGPPVSNATMSVGYVKGYFNSSLSSRQSSWAARCKDPTAMGAICAIPDQITPPDPAVVTGNSTAANGYFFSSDTNKTVNQTVYKKSSAPTIDSNLYTISIALLGAVAFLAMCF